MNDPHIDRVLGALEADLEGPEFAPRRQRSVAPDAAFNTLMSEPRADARAPTDKYMAEASYFFSQWGDRCRLHDEAMVAASSRYEAMQTRCAEALQDLAAAQAKIESQATVIATLQSEVGQAREREAKAMEAVGVMKGVMHSHGASIADVIGKVS